MNKQSFFIDDLKINIKKNRKNRRIRLTINSTGEINVTIPTYTSYKAGLNFAKSKIDWIKKKKPEKKIYQDNQQIGKNHHLSLCPDNQDNLRSKVTLTDIIIKYPKTYDYDSQIVQEYISKVTSRALKKEAENLLPQRLRQLSLKYQLPYNQLKIRNLKSRWGSCNNLKVITLSQNLLNLPWELIDYVIIHELIHTRHMNHSIEFWNNFDKLMPNNKNIRKKLKKSIY